MDRPIVYAGAVPLDTDLLRLGRYAKEGLGHLAEALLGHKTIMASGLVCKPMGRGLVLTVDPGVIIAPRSVDSSRIGSISAGLEAEPRVTQCLFYHDTTEEVVVPLTGAMVTLYALCKEQDDMNEVLPFYNADKPDQTMAGPDNRGKALPTRRTGRMRFVVATSPPSSDDAVVVPLYRLNVPSMADNLTGLVPQATEVFLPTLPQLATMSFVQQLCEPPALCVASGILRAPEWASRVELRVIGGGGGGASSNVQSPEYGSFSGAGGGAGGDAWGVYRIDPSYDASLSATIGLGGASDIGGGTTFVTYNGQPLLSAEGGAPGRFASAQSAVGGAGGTARGGTLWSQNGGAGSDGQFGNWVLTGNGADGPWGGSGRAGALLGMNATRYGAGGGGAYSARTAGQAVPGGRGFQGCVLYRFLV